MVELASTHLGYFLKVASKKLIFLCFGFFFFLSLSGAAVFVNLLLWHSHVKVVF